MYLAPMEFKSQRIMTTKVLAEQYGSEEGNIQKNYSRNEKRFTEGKHYYKLEGPILKDFKQSLPTESLEPIKFAPVLYLWTDRGAARHAKILDTDEAWEVYETLEDTYFKVVNNENEQRQPIGMLEAMQIELQNTRQELEELKKVVYKKERQKLSNKKHQLGIGNTLEQRMNSVNDDEIFDIIRYVLSIGTLRDTEKGFAVDKDIVFNEAKKRNIDKYILNKKLAILSIVVLNNNNYPYRQVKIDGEPKWCYVVKRDVI